MSNKPESDARLAPTTGSAADTARLDFVLEHLKGFPPIRVYPCQTEDGSGYFTCDMGHGPRFTGDTPRAAIDAAMQPNDRRSKNFFR